MVKNQKYLSVQSTQTRKVGEKLAEEVIKTPKKDKAIVIGLKGDLGGGKTTFLQGFAKGLGIKERVLSPTFVLLRRYRIPKTKSSANSKIQTLKFKNFYHIDCYRLEKLEEILDLDFKKVASNPQNILAIEWSDKIEKILPPGAIRINLEFISKNKRKITINI